MIIRLRTSNGMVRVNISDEGTLGDLRKRIVDQLSIRLEDQILLKQARTWFSDVDDEKDSSMDDFPNPDCTLQEVGLSHGTILILNQKSAQTMPETQDSNSPTDSDETTEHFVPLVFKGINLEAIEDQKNTARGHSSSDSSRGNIESLQTEALYLLKQSATDIRTYLNDLNREQATKTHSSIESLLQIIYQRSEMISRAVIHLGKANPKNCQQTAMANSILYAIEPLDSAGTYQALNPHGDNDDGELDNNDHRSRDQGGDNNDPYNGVSKNGDNLVSTPQLARPDNRQVKCRNEKHKLLYEDAKRFKAKYLKLRERAQKMNDAGLRLKKAGEDNAAMFKRKIARRDDKICRLEQRLEQFEEMLKDRDGNNQRPDTGSSQGSGKGSYPIPPSKQRAPTPPDASNYHYNGDDSIGIQIRSKPRSRPSSASRRGRRPSTSSSSSSMEPSWLQGGDHFTGNKQVGQTDTPIWLQQQRNQHNPSPSSSTYFTPSQHPSMQHHQEISHRRRQIRASIARAQNGVSQVNL